MTIMRRSFFSSALLVSTLLAVNTASMAEPLPATPAAASTAVATSKTTGTPPVKTATKPAQPTAQQYQQEIKKGNIRIQQLEQANQTALARNQELQLGNDNLTVQVQVLQSERSAQMFLYGAATLGAGTIMGFILCNYMLGKRNRRW